jgi:transposase-like protein
MRFFNRKKTLLCPVCGAKLKAKRFMLVGKNKTKYICPHCDFVIKGDTCFFFSEGEGNLR